MTHSGTQEQGGEWPHQRVKLESWWSENPIENQRKNTRTPRPPLSVGSHHCAVLAKLANIQKNCLGLNRGSLAETTTAFILQSVSCTYDLWQVICHQARPQKRPSLSLLGAGLINWISGTRRAGQNRQYRVINRRIILLSHTKLVLCLFLLWAFKYNFINHSGKKNCLSVRVERISLGLKCLYFCISSITPDMDWLGLSREKWQKWTL